MGVGGVGFAIPVAAVEQIVPSLIATGASVPVPGRAFDNEISLAEQSAFGLTQTQGAYVVNVTIELTIARGGETLALPVTLSARPNASQFLHNFFNASEQAPAMLFRVARRQFVGQANSLSKQNLTRPPGDFD